MADISVEKERTFSAISFFLLSIVIGIVAGLGAVAFRGLIALFHNLSFLGKFSFSYNANVHTAASPWGPFIILVPIGGALIVVFLIKNFAPEAKGHGVPEVIDSIYYNKGIIRPIVALIKSIASALSIGIGGSVGREGPIIQIGASFGSTVGQILKMSVWQRITLIAAGAGGGIAATFNTPIGGILFAIEIMMHEVSVRTLVPVSIATVVATYVGQLFFGSHPSFVVPGLETAYFQTASPWVLITYIGLGIIMGLISVLYLKSIYWFEDIFEKYIKVSYYLRHAIGMALVGITFYLLMVAFGHYYIQGVGYATVQDVLEGNLNIVYILVLLFVLKLLAVSLTLGSGASGGIFSPGLYMGATMGGVYGIVLSAIFPSLSITPPAFAVAGMAGVIGGSTGAAMAAIVMIFEMTRDYTVIMPMAITVAVSYLIRRKFTAATIYTEKLLRRGHTIPEELIRPLATNGKNKELS
jgi:CIC family chloride channel protein